MATTPETPVANDYLERRAELAAALATLTDLAVEANAPAETIQTLGHLQAGLREPFLFVVVGEVKAGKSSLLNALFGQEFCRVDVLPATDRVHVFRYGDTPRDVPLHAELVERYQPVGFLRDFHIVDTPGTNTVVSQHQRITESFVPMADLILFVFSVVNPWGATARQFFEHIQGKWLKKVVFVVQQADLREGHEVQTVVQHLRQTATARIGQAFPIFAVSAKKAFLSKTTGVDKARLWAESQFGPLEDYINEIVAGGEARREKLRNTLRTARVMLGDLGAGARREHGVASADRAELVRVRAAVEAHPGRADLGVDSFLRAVDTAFVRCLHQGENQLRQRVQLGATLGLVLGEGNRRWPLDFQRNFESMLHAALARQTAGALDLLEAELRNFWAPLSERLRTSLSSGAREILAPGPGDFAEGRPRLAERIEAATVETLTDERMESELQGSFVGLVRTARRMCWVALVVLVAGGALVGWGLVPLWANLVTVAVLVLVVGRGVRAAAEQRRRLLENYRVRMRERQAALSEAVAGLVRQAVQSFYRRIEAVYAPLEGYCQARETTHVPLLERVTALDGTLEQIATRL